MNRNYEVDFDAMDIDEDVHIGPLKPCNGYFYGNQGNVNLSYPFTATARPTSTEGGCCGKKRPIEHWLDKILQRPLKIQKVNEEAEQSAPVQSLPERRDIGINIYSVATVPKERCKVFEKRKRVPKQTQPQNQGMEYKDMCRIQIRNWFQQLNKLDLPLILKTIIDQFAREIALPSNRNFSSFRKVLVKLLRKFHPDRCAARTVEESVAYEEIYKYVVDLKGLLDDNKMT